MRVLMLGWEFPPRQSGGLGTACQGLARALAGLGVGVRFVLPSAAGKPAAVPGPRGALRLHPIPSALQPYARPAGANALYGGDLAAEVQRYASEVECLARSKAFDLVHAHDWMTWPAARRVQAESGRPLVCHVHSLEVDRAGRMADAGIRALEQEGLSAADRIVCVSQFTAAQIRRHYRVDATRIRVVHNAVARRRTLARARWPRNVGEPIVLFLGRVTAQKGPDRFLEAAARVAAAEPRVKFVVAGSGDLLPAMVERVAALGLARRFHFTGFLSPDEVDRVLAQAAVYVMPSVSEPFGIAPLEAMSADVPVIVSKQSGVCEVLRHALKVDGWDTEGIADRILAVLRHPALSRELAEDGRREVGRLRWEHRARSLLDVYAELAA